MKPLSISFIFILLLLLLQGFSEASSSLKAVDEGSNNNPVAEGVNTEAFHKKGHYCKRIRICQRRCKKVGIKKYCHRSCRICCKGYCL